mmetsp:Transcript_877/g.1838  ORF Transcript_877/g.1838 Transcript_877/m.1838 type:complete len:346 (+) Transcript_877:174-1211(+)
MIKCIHRLLPIQFVVVIGLSICPSFLEANLRESQKLLRKLKIRDRNMLSEYPLDRCRGDCDGDEDCKGNLICFQRKSYESVPGCRGGNKDATSTDYCIDPKYIAPVNNNDFPELKYLGRNPTTNSFPLQECEGDCDKNSDCDTGLICLQRRHENSGSIPGCRGLDDSLVDYCVKSSFLYQNEQPKSPPSPSNAKSLEVLEDFGLKLYWQPKYLWQEEDFDRRWCMECINGKCEYGDKTFIHTCERAISQRYDFVFVNDNDAMIRVHGTNLCFERIFIDIFLYDCDWRNQRQLWFGDFRNERFEIKPSGFDSHCITQRHHPKFHEEVEIEPCLMARSSHTSYWTRY